MDFQKKYTDGFVDKVFLSFVPERVTPNQITWFRLFSAPFIFYLLWIEMYSFGFTFFVISALTDVVDGAKARTRNQITELGKILDPIADRALIGSVAITLIPLFYGWPLFITLLVLELFQAIRAHFIKERLKRNLDANWAGKSKMILQTVGFGFLFLGIFTSSNGLIYSAGTMILISLIFLVIEPFIYMEEQDFG